MLRNWRERRALRRLENRDAANLSAAEREELQRLQQEHSTIHMGDPHARMYREYDEGRPRK